MLGVVASHVFQSNYQGRGPVVYAVGELFHMGAKGVDLFFVLSGFLITGILFDSLPDPGYFRKFYARRCLRIFPLYYGVLLALFVLTPWLGIQWNQEQWPLLLYLQNTNVVRPVWDFVMPHGLTLSHFWSLAVEEQFYLVWPLAVFLVRSRRHLLGVCAALAVFSMLLRIYLSIHQVPELRITSGTLTRADSLLCGGALALLTRGRWKKQVLAAGQALACGSALALIVLAIAAERMPFRESGHSMIHAVSLSLGVSLWALGSGGLIAWSLRPGSVVCRMFENGVLRWFGKYSYGLYVLHLIAMASMLDVFREWLAHVTSSRVTVIFVAGLMVAGISVAAAYASFELFEKRLLLLKRYFEYERPERIPR